MFPAAFSGEPAEMIVAKRIGCAMHTSVVEYEVAPAARALVTDQLPRSGIATLASYVTVACIAVGLVSAWLGLCVITG